MAMHIVHTCTEENVCSTQTLFVTMLDNYFLPKIRGKRRPGTVSRNLTSSSNCPRFTVDLTVTPTVQTRCSAVPTVSLNIPRLSSGQRWRVVKGLLHPGTRSLTSGPGAESWAVRMGLHSHLWMTNTSLQVTAVCI